MIRLVDANNVKHIDTKRVHRDSYWNDLFLIFLRSFVSVRFFAHFFVCGELLLLLLFTCTCFDTIETIQMSYVFTVAQLCSGAFECVCEYANFVVRDETNTNVPKSEREQRKSNGATVNY